MSNSYAISPGFVPGDLTVTGIAKVTGNQVRVGAAAPFLRIVKEDPGDQSGDFTYNIDPVTGALDDATKFAAGIGWTSLTHQWVAKSIPAAAAVSPVFLSGGAQETAVAQVITGDTLVHTVGSKIIRANTLGLVGQLYFKVLVNATTQGAVAGTLQVTLGAGVMASVPVSAAGLIYLRGFIANKNAANAQVAYSIATLGSPQNDVTALVNRTVDTTVDQTLSITIQLGTATDSWTFAFSLVSDTFGGGNF